LYIYVRFWGEHFSAKHYSSIQKIIEIAFEDIRYKRALPCSVIDECGNVLYNKREIKTAIEEYCLKQSIDWEFIYNE
jgi:hypothetical protein